MRRWLRRAGALIAVPAVAYFAFFAWRTATLHDLRSLLTRPMILAVSAAAVAYASVIPASSWAWGRLLRGAGVRLPVLELNLILGLTQIGKYLPGSVAQHLGRTAMSIERGIPATALVLTLVVEVLLTMAAALAVGVAGLALAARGAGSLPAAPLRSATLAGLCLLALIAGLGIALRRPGWLPGEWGPRLAAVKAGSWARSSAAAFLAYVANFVVVGASLYGVASVAAGGAPAGLPFFVGVLALSWIAGFVAPGAPAGLGVREGVMAALLSPTVDSARALETIVAFRVATTVGDLLGFGWGAALYAASSRQRPRGQGGGTAVPPSSRANTSS
ncbi:MAG TPA: lysylphosphatidylglycerol synthase domain-containing protein [Vicinamibacteria bacterium]